MPILGEIETISTLQIVVCRKHGKWLIRAGDKVSQSFADQRSAAKAAVDLAYKSGKDGKPALVMMRTASPLKQSGPMALTPIRCACPAERRSASAAPR
jgi:hypothetical protein